MFFAKIEKCQLFFYELILELFARSWSPSFPIQFSEIRSSVACLAWAWLRFAWLCMAEFAVLRFALLSLAWLSIA